MARTRGAPKTSVLAVFSHVCWLTVAVGGRPSKDDQSSNVGSRGQDNKKPSEETIQDMRFDPRIFGRMEDYHPDLISGKVNASRSGFNAKSSRVYRNILKNVRTEVCLLAFQVCAPFPQCGAFVTCNSPVKVVVCQGCSATPSNGPPPNICNFEMGRCERNNNAAAGIAGSICTTTGKCTGKGLYCRSDTRVPGQKRCCRKSCPPGAYGSPDFWYTNECGERLLCPNGYRPT